MDNKQVKRFGTHRHNGPICIMNPMPNGPEKKILKPGTYVFDGNTFVPYDEYYKRKENDAPAVHTDQGWIEKFDYGAGKKWSDHGGRRGRENWMKNDGVTCKG